MRSAKYFVLSSMVMFFLVGCSMQPGWLKFGSQQKAISVAETIKVESEDTVVISVSVLTLPAPPNPYLESMSTAPGGAQQLFKRAVTSQQEGNDEDARIWLKQLISEFPQLSGSFYNLALLEIKQGNAEEAEKLLLQAVTVNQNNLYAFNQLGVLLKQQGRFVEAEEAYLSSLQIWPAFNKARLNLAFLSELYLGKLAEALYHYQMYQQYEINPDQRLDGWLADLQRRVAEEQRLPLDMPTREPEVKVNATPVEVAKPSVELDGNDEQAIDDPLSHQGKASEEVAP